MIAQHAAKEGYWLAANSYSGCTVFGWVTILPQ